MDSEDLIIMLLLLITLNSKYYNSNAEIQDTEESPEKEYGIIL